MISVDHEITEVPAEKVSFGVSHKLSVRSLLESQHGKNGVRISDSTLNENSDDCFIVQKIFNSKVYKFGGQILF